MKRATSIGIIAALTALAALGEEEQVSKYLISTNAFLDEKSATWTLVGAPKVTGYRLELETFSDGSEAAYVIGCDGVRRQVVLLSPGEYNAMQDKIETIYKALHGTPEGRKALHGKVVEHVVDSHSKEMVDVHADGYRHVTAMLQAPRKGTGTRTRAKQPISPLPPRLNTRGESRREISARHKKMREELRAALGKPAKEVTVEHDANTGKDTVK